MPRDDLKGTLDTRWRAFGLLADDDKARPDAARRVDEFMARIKEEYGLTDAELTAPGNAADSRG